jgi:nucleoside-diphosphate-sugar epimerase
MNMLNAAKQNPHLERFIQTSTSEVYGTARYTPIDEIHPLQPQSPYSASKIGSDSMALSYFLSFELPVTVIRPFNTYGPRQSARAVIPTIISQLLAQKAVKLGSLEPKRDFLYVQDTVRGFRDVGTHTGTIGKTLNLGVGKSITIGELYAKLCNLMDTKTPAEVEAARLRPKNSEVLHLECNPTLAQNITGWQAKTSLDDGLTQTIDYIRQNIHRYDTSTYNV